MYSIDARKMVLTIYEYFGSMRKAAKVARVSISTISRWNKQILPSQDRKKRPSKLSDVITSFILLTSSKQPTLRCIDIAKLVNETFDLSISRQLVHLVFKKNDISFKRVRKRGRSLTKQSRIANFVDKMKSLPTTVKLIAVDESGFDERTSPYYGYSKKGEKVILEYDTTKDRKHYSLLMAVWQCQIKENHFMN